MVFPLRMPLQLRAVEVDVPQVPGAVPQRLIVEVSGLWVTALAPRGHGLGAHAVSELDHRNETISTGSIVFLRPRVGTRPERRQ